METGKLERRPKIEVPDILLIVRNGRRRLAIVARDTCATRTRRELKFAIDFRHLRSTPGRADRRRPGLYAARGSGDSAGAVARGAISMTRNTPSDGRPRERQAHVAGIIYSRGGQTTAFVFFFAPQVSNLFI